MDPILIDTLRAQITGLRQSAAVFDQQRLMHLSEAERLNEEAAQVAARADEMEAALFAAVPELAEPEEEPEEEPEPDAEEPPAEDEAPVE